MADLGFGQRILKAIGRSGLWQGIGRVHVRLYRMSGGRIGGRTGPLTHLLLTTTGRKTGEARTVPLPYLDDAGRMVIVGSNGGTDRHPAWVLNLRADPNATVQRLARTVAVVAHEATGAERAALWPKLKAMNPAYGQYEQMTERQIPVVVLAPR